MASTSFFDKIEPGHEEAPRKGKARIERTERGPRIVINGVSFGPELFKGHRDHGGRADGGGDGKFSFDLLPFEPERHTLEEWAERIEEEVAHEGILLDTSSGWRYGDLSRGGNKQASSGRKSKGKGGRQAHH